MARSNTLETHTKNILQLAQVRMLETGAEKAKCAACAVKRESYIPITKLKTCACRHTARLFDTTFKVRYEWRPKAVQAQVSSTSIEVRGSKCVA